MRSALATGPKRVREIAELLRRDRKLVTYHLITLQIRGFAQVDGHQWSLTANGGAALPVMDPVEDFIATCAEFEAVSAAESELSAWDPEPIAPTPTPTPAPPARPAAPVSLAKVLPIAPTPARQRQAAPTSSPLGAVEGRPATRGDCINGERPCPYIACRFNLYLDVTKAGAVHLTFPNLEPDQMVESCALDVIDRDGAVTLMKVGACFGVTRERIRQIEQKAAKKLRHGLAEYRDIESSDHASAFAAAMEDA